MHNLFYKYVLLLEKKTITNKITKFYCLVGGMLKNIFVLFNPLFVLPVFDKTKQKYKKKLKKKHTLCKKKINK